jgi:hypothetical protein
LNQESKHDLKEKIRQRYKGGDLENMHPELPEKYSVLTQTRG